MQGAKINDYVPTYENCRVSIEENIFNYLYLNTWFENEELDFWATADNLTLTIANTSTLIKNCYMVGDSTARYMPAYISEFGDADARLNNYILSFFSQMGGNVASYYLIIDDVSQATEICDLVTVYLSIGKIVRLLLDVEPVVFATLEEPMSTGSEQRNLKSLVKGKKNSGPAYTPVRGFREEYEEHIFGLKCHEDLYEELRPKKQGLHMSDFKKPKQTEKRLQQTVQERIVEYIEVTIGFLNGTGLISTQNSHLCEDSFVYSMDTSRSIFPNFQTKTIDGVKDAVFNIGDLLEMSFWIQYACRQSYFEGADTLETYVTGYDEFVDYSDVFAYNFGLIYTTIFELIADIGVGEWYNAGYGLGYIIWLSFFTARR